jgi:hypothetical protein
MANGEEELELPTARLVPDGPKWADMAVIRQNVQLYI